MSGKGIWLAVLGFLGFMGLVIWSSMPGGGTRCEVCMSFNGMRNCATAQAATAHEAERAARTTACAPISGGVTESLQCDATQPASRSCQGG